MMSSDRSEEQRASPSIASDQRSCLLPWGGRRHGGGWTTCGRVDQGVYCQEGPVLTVPEEERERDVRVMGDSEGTDSFRRVFPISPLLMLDSHLPRNHSRTYLDTLVFDRNCGVEDEKSDLRKVVILIIVVCFDC